MSSPDVGSLSDGSSLSRLLRESDTFSSSSLKLVVPHVSSIYNRASTEEMRIPQESSEDEEDDDQVSLRFPRSTGGTFGYEPLQQQIINDVSTSEPSWVMSNTTSSSYNQILSYSKLAQGFPQSYVEGEGAKVAESTTTGIAPYSSNVPGLVRRSSSRRKVVINKAPSIKSEKNRFSVISEETYITKRKNSVNKGQGYEFYAQKKKLFKFMPSSRRKNSIKYKYKHKDNLLALFENSTQLQQNEIYIRNKVNPLVLQQFELPQIEKLKSSPKLRAKMKLASFDLNHQLHLDDATSDIIDLYFSEYSTEARQIPTTNTKISPVPIVRAPSRTRSVASSTKSKEKEYKRLKRQFFQSKTRDSRDLFALIDSIPEEYIKRLALTIYLRRLMAAKVLLRMNLENSSIDLSSYLSSVGTKGNKQSASGENFPHETHATTMFPSLQHQQQSSGIRAS